jgi:hypothetical protein
MNIIDNGISNTTDSQYNPAQLALNQVQMALGLNNFDSTLIQEFTNDFDESSVNSESRIGHMTNSLDSKASPDKLSSGDRPTVNKPP